MAVGAIASLALLNPLPSAAVCVISDQRAGLLLRRRGLKPSDRQRRLVVPFALRIRVASDALAAERDLRFKMPGLTPKPTRTGPGSSAPTMLGHDLMAMQQGAAAPECPPRTAPPALAEHDTGVVQAVVLGDGGRGSDAGVPDGS